MSKTYTTIQGDMWDGIAHNQLGSVKYMDALINANIQHRNVYVFSAGVQLIIPDIETTVTSDKLPPWKQVNK